MITVRIGEAEREIGSADESWISQQLRRRREDGLSVCVRVFIKEGDLDLILSTPTCETSGVCGRPPRSLEIKVLDLWKTRKMNESDFTVGNLIAFLKQLTHII